MKNIKYYIFVSLIFISGSVLSQAGSSESNAKYKMDFGWVMAYGISHVLDKHLLFLDSSHCINALFIVRFNIDSAGNVCNIRFSNDTTYEKEGYSYAGFDASVKHNINHDLDSVLRKTSGSWIPAQKNGTPCLSKPLAIIIACNRNVGKACSERQYGPEIIGGYPIFDEEGCIMYSYLRWFGNYKS